jgi:hypothetical protein
MRNRSFLFGLLLAAVLLPAALAQPITGPMTKLTVAVHTPGGHAIDNAEVIVRWHANKKHPAERYGKEVNTTFEMRTNQEGQATMPSIPQGSILVQVNAKGYQTYGKVIDIDETEKTIEVALNPPQQQYSAH